MPIIEAILYFCEECQTVSLDGGICIQCGEPLMVDTFVPKAAQQGVQPDFAPRGGISLPPVGSHATNPFADQDKPQSR